MFAPETPTATALVTPQTSATTREVLLQDRAPRDTGSAASVSKVNVS